MYMDDIKLFAKKKPLVTQLEYTVITSECNLARKNVPRL